MTRKEFLQRLHRKTGRPFYEAGGWLALFFGLMAVSLLAWENGYWPVSVVCWLLQAHIGHLARPQHRGRRMRVIQQRRRAHKSFVSHQLFGVQPAIRPTEDDVALLRDAAHGVVDRHEYTQRCEIRDTRYVIRDTGVEARAPLRTGPSRISYRVSPIGLQIAPSCLLPLDRLKQRPEIPFAEGIGAGPLDDLIEQRRPVLDGFGKELQQVTFLILIDEDAQLLDRLVVLAHIPDAVPQRFIIAVGHAEEFDAVVAQHRHGMQNIARRQRDVLHTGAGVVIEIFLNLALPLAGSRLVDRATPPSPPRARLQIMASDGSEREFELPASAITIGKAEDKQLRIKEGAIRRKNE